VAIVKPNYLPLRSGKACAGQMAASADYYGRRPGPDLDRGESRTWIADDGRRLEHHQAKRELREAMRQWCAEGKGQDSGDRLGGARVYRIVLSTRDVPLTNADLARALDTVTGPPLPGPGSPNGTRGREARWWLVRHDGGSHPHAHAILLVDRGLGVRDLQRMRGTLEERELLRTVERDQAVELAREARREGAASPVARALREVQAQELAQERTPERPTPERPQERHSREPGREAPPGPTESAPAPQSDRDRQREAEAWRRDALAAGRAADREIEADRRRALGEAAAADRQIDREQERGRRARDHPGVER
jgi:hypothetical protein